MAVGVLVGLVGAFNNELLPSEPEWWHRMLVFVAGLLIIGLPVYFYGLVRAPYLQRKEARTAHVEHHRSMDVELRLRSCFVEAAPKSVVDRDWFLIKFADLRVTNREKSSVSLEFQLVIRREPISGVY